METNNQTIYQEETVPGRPARRTADEWASLIKKYECSARSIRQFCEDHGFRPSAFYYWRDKLAGKKRRSQGKESPRGRFVPVSVSPHSSTRIKITLPPGIILESSSLIDIDWIISLMDQLSKKS